MADQSHTLRICSKNAAPVKFILIGSAFLSFIPSFLIMGTAFARMFVISYVAFNAIFAIFLAAYVLLLPSNWFEYDDDNKTIRKAFRKRIPYNKIKAIVIAETPISYTVSVKTNWMPPYPIASGLNKDDATLVENEFKRRFPAEIVRRESYSKKRFTVEIVIAGLIVIIVLSLYSFYHLEPSKVIAPEKKDWITSNFPQEGGKFYQIDGIKFLMPERFVQVKQDKVWLYYEDALNKTKIIVGPGLTQDANLKNGGVIGFLTGIQNDYDLFRLAYTARYGLLPYLTNSTSFRELSEIKLYEINRGTLQGIVLQGMKGNKSVAEIIIAENTRGLHFYLSQPGEIGKLKEELLQSLVASLKSEAN